MKREAALALGSLVTLGSLIYAAAVLFVGPAAVAPDGSEVRLGPTPGAWLAFGFPLWAGAFVAAARVRAIGFAGLFLALYGGQAFLFGFGVGGRLLVTGLPVLAVAFLFLVFAGDRSAAEDPGSS